MHVVKLGRMESNAYLVRKHHELVADADHSRENARADVVEAGSWWLQVVRGIFQILAVTGANDTGKQRACGPAETGLLQRSY